MMMKMMIGYNFNLQKYLKEGHLVESELDVLGKELAAAIEIKLDDKKEELNEVIDPISILSYLLAGTTLTNILSKWVGKLFKKYDFGKGEEAANSLRSSSVVAGGVSSLKAALKGKDIVTLIKGIAKAT